MLKYITHQHAEYLLIKSVFFAFFLAMVVLAMPIAAVEHDLIESTSALQKWENPDGKDKPLMNDSSRDDELKYNEESILEGYAVTYYPRE